MAPAPRVSGRAIPKVPKHQLPNFSPVLGKLSPAQPRRATHMPLNPHSCCRWQNQGKSYLSGNEEPAQKGGETASS